MISTTVFAIMETIHAGICRLWSFLKGKDLPYVSTQVRYYKPLPIHQDEKPYECEFSVDAVNGARRTNIELEVRDTNVYDIRGVEEQYKLERNGFEIIIHSSGLSRQDLPLVKILSHDIYQNVRRLFASGSMPTKSLLWDSMSVCLL